MARVQKGRKGEEPGASHIPRQTVSRNHPSTNIHPEMYDKRHCHILEGVTYLVIALIECFLPGHPVPHSQVPIGQIGKLLNRPGMVVDSVIIRPVPNRRFIDYGWIRLCRIRLRFIGGREEKLFFKLFVVAAFINKALLVLDDVAAPTYMWLMAMRVAPQ